MEIKEAIEILQNARNRSKATYIHPEADFVVSTQEAIEECEALQFAIQTLQEVADGRRPLLPCMPEFWMETATGRIIRIVRIAIEVRGTYISWRYKHESAMHECDSAYFWNHFTREAAEKALEAGK